MRDWLALPLSNSSSSTTTTRSITNSEEDDYDVINKPTTSEEEDDEELEPAWVTLLNAFVGIDKQQLQEIRKEKKRSISVSSSERCIEELDVARKPLNNKIVIKDEPIFINNEEDDGDKHGENTEEEEEEEEEVEDYLPFTEFELKRTMSNSSLASSTDTDNSTPASSQIMGPSSSSFHDKMSTTTTNTRLVEIHWNHGGKTVQVTGEFDNWSGSVDMIKDTGNSHVAMIPIDSTKDIEYKFIVDGEWKYAMDLPHRTDWRGNVNNVVYKLE